MDVYDGPIYHGVEVDDNFEGAIYHVKLVGGGGGDQHNLGWYATQAALEEAHPTAEAGDWAIVGSTDTVWVWDTDNSEWVDSDQKGQVTSVNGQTGAVTISADDIIKVNSTITLTAAGWSSNTQTVTVNGITSTGVVFVSPDPADQADYTSAGILCTAQATDSLTFTCDTTPSSDIDVVVVQM